jgi:hypothetical protein
MLCPRCVHGEQFPADRDAVSSTLSTALRSTTQESVNGLDHPCGLLLHTPTARHFPVSATSWEADARAHALVAWVLGCYKGAVSAVRLLDPANPYRLPLVCQPTPSYIAAGLGPRYGHDTQAFQEIHTPRRHHCAREPRCEPAASASSKPPACQTSSPPTIPMRLLP